MKGSCVFPNFLHDFQINKRQNNYITRPKHLVEKNLLSCILSRTSGRSDIRTTYLCYYILWICSIKFITDKFISELLCLSHSSSFVFILRYMLYLAHYQFGQLILYSLTSSLIAMPYFFQSLSLFQSLP